MLDLRRAVIIAACIAAGITGTACSDDDGTGVDGPPLPLGDTVVATTAADGQATVTFQGRDENQYQIAVTLQDFDTDRAAAGLEVHAIALADGGHAGFEDALDRFLAACAADQVACSGFGGADPATAAGNHSNLVVFDEDVLPAGAGLYAAMALGALAG